MATILLLHMHENTSFSIFVNIYSSTEFQSFQISFRGGTYLGLKRTDCLTFYLIHLKRISSREWAKRNQSVCLCWQYATPEYAYGWMLNVWLWFGYDLWLKRCVNGVAPSTKYSCKFDDFARALSTHTRNKSQIAVFLTALNSNQKCLFVVVFYFALLSSQCNATCNTSHMDFWCLYIFHQLQIHVEFKRYQMHFTTQTYNKQIGWFCLGSLTTRKEKTVVGCYLFIFICFSFFSRCSVPSFIFPISFAVLHLNRKTKCEKKKTRKVCGSLKRGLDFFYR